MHSWLSTDYVSRQKDLKIPSNSMTDGHQIDD